MVIIIIASEHDKPVSEKIEQELKKFNIEYEIYVSSAHKVPELVYRIVEENNRSDKKICYITVAGRSNGLSGLVAANSIHPVIACPNFADKTDYLVNIHSTLQMPSDTPLLTVIQPENAALAAVRILGLSDEKILKATKMRLAKMKSSYKKYPLNE